MEWKFFPISVLSDCRIARFVGGAEYSFSGEATLSSDTHRKAWSRPPIGMEFSIVMFTSSGLLVRYLKVIEKSGYKYFPTLKDRLTVVLLSGSSISQELRGEVMKFGFKDIMRY